MAAKGLIEKNDFAGALQVLQSFGREYWDPGLILILEHCRRRINLDFNAVGKDVKGLNKLIEGEKTDFNKDRIGIINQMQDDVYDTLHRVNELNALINVHLDGQMWADALQRIGSYRELCEAIFIIGVLAHGKKKPGVFFKRNIQHYIEGWFPKSCDLRLDKYLCCNGCEEKEHKRRKGWSAEGKNQHHFTEYVNQLVYEHELVCWQEAGELIEKGDFFSRLRTIRNSIIHRTEPATHAQITGVIGLCKLREFLDNVANKLYECLSVTRPEKDPYCILREEMMRLIEK